MTELQRIIESELPKIKGSTPDLPTVEFSPGLPVKLIQIDHANIALSVSDTFAKRVALVIAESNLYCVDTEDELVSLPRHISAQRLSRIARRRMRGQGLTVLDCGLTTNVPKTGQFNCRDILFYKNQDVRSLPFANRLILLSGFLADNGLNSFGAPTSETKSVSRMLAKPLPHGKYFYATDLHAPYNEGFMYVTPARALF